MKTTQERLEGAGRFVRVPRLIDLDPMPVAGSLAAVMPRGKAAFVVCPGCGVDVMPGVPCAICAERREGGGDE